MDVELKVPNMLIHNAFERSFENCNTDCVCTIHKKENIILNDVANNNAHTFKAPYSIGQILDQTQQILNTSSHLPHEISIGDNTFFPESSLFKKDGVNVSLTEKEKALIIELWHGLPEAVSKDSLLKSIWEYQTELETHTLETHIYRLRQKIEDDPTIPEILITDKDGYRLNIARS